MQPDLSIAESTTTPSGSDTTVSATESSVTYNLVVTNASAGPQNATGVRINDTVPGFIAGRTRSPPHRRHRLRWHRHVQLQRLRRRCHLHAVGWRARAGADRHSADHREPASQDGTFTNTATVTNTVQGDPNSANNSASALVTITPIADVEMTGKSVTPASVGAGVNATYVLSYRNNGPSIALGVVVTDSFISPSAIPG